MAQNKLPHKDQSQQLNYQKVLEIVQILHQKLKQIEYIDQKQQMFNQKQKMMQLRVEKSLRKSNWKKNGNKMN